MSSESDDKTVGPGSFCESYAMEIKESQKWYHAWRKGELKLDNNNKIPMKYTPIKGSVETVI